MSFLQGHEGRARHAPRNAVPCVVEAGERRAETDGAGHQRVVCALTLSVNIDPVVDARNVSLLQMFAAESCKALVKAGAGKSPRKLRSRDQCIES